MDRFKSSPLTTNRGCDDGNRSERERASQQGFNPSIHYLLTGGSLSNYHEQEVLLPQS